MPTVISQNITWAAGQTVTLSDDIQVAPDVILTIEAGATVNGNGHAIVAFGGTVRAGTEGAAGVALNDVSLQCGSDYNTSGRLELNGVEMNGGSFLSATENGPYGSFIVRNTAFTGVDGFEIWYPDAPSEFIGNSFDTSHRLSIGTSKNEVLVQNNAFYASRAPNNDAESTITVWNASSGTDLIRVINNTFYDGPGVSTYLQLQSGFEGAALFAAGNYFEASNGTNAKGFVLDSQDDLPRAADIDLGTRQAPHMHQPPASTGQPTARY